MKVEFSASLLAPSDHDQTLPATRGRDVRTRADIVVPVVVVHTRVVSSTKQSVAGTIVASNMNAASVSVLDIASGVTLATVSTGPGLHAVAIWHSGKWPVIAIYGDQNGSGTIGLVVDVTHPTAATRTIELGTGNQHPQGVQFTTDDRTLLITRAPAQRLLFVDFACGQIDSAMVTGRATTHMMALTIYGKHAFTANISAMSVPAIEVTGCKLGAAFLVGQRVEGLAVTRMVAKSG